jgi:type IV pilus assembly protein PilQ
MDSKFTNQPSNIARHRVSLHGVMTLVLSIAVLCFATGARAADETANTLKDIHFSSLGGNRVQIELVLENPVAKPSSFTIDNPARIALDFPDTASALKRKTENIDIGAARSITAVEARGRTRVVLNLVKLVPFDMQVKDNSVFITLEGESATAAASTASPFMLTPEAKASAMAKAGATAVDRLEGIDFRRGTQGEGRVVVNLTDPDAAIDMHQEGDKIVVDFFNTAIADKLVKRYDVVDFATPVHTIDLFRNDGSVRMVIDANGPYEHLAYQTKEAFTVEVKPVTKKEQETAKKEEFGYTGKKLSLNFQNIEVRAALQLIADFTDLNMVTSDSVNGNLTLRLQNVPWDQALDIILKTKGLAMRKMGNVILVAPAAEIASHEKQELESKKQIQELAPLHSELVQVNYAKAADITKIIKAKGNSLMSERGNVTIDERTNTLLIQDTDDKLVEIRKLIAKLDVPVRQVLIESRIVIANNDFNRDLGVRLGMTDVRNHGSTGVIATTGSAAGTDTMVNSAITNVQTNGTPYPVSLPSQPNRFNVDLPAVESNAASIGLAILGPNYLLDLELSALQAEGRGEVVSSPRVITANQREALIEQGVEIPYQQATSSGATSVSFKKATLSLKVTPQITPDDRIIMDLNVTKDSVGAVFLGVPSINTREISTQVLVDNGQTVVLGGVFEQTHTDSTTKVPLLGDLPILGHLFKQSSNVNNKEELLVFITPKILKEGLSLNQ